MGGDTSEIWRYPTHTLRKGRHENYLIGKCDLDGFTRSACSAMPACGDLGREAEEKHFNIVDKVQCEALVVVAI